MLLRRQGGSLGSGGPPAYHQRLKALLLGRREEAVGAQLLYDDQGARLVRRELGGEGVSGFPSRFALGMLLSSDSPVSESALLGRYRQDSNRCHGDTLLLAIRVVP